MRRDGWIDREHGGRGNRERHRLEILVRIVGNFIEQRRIDHAGAERKQDGIAVGRGACRLSGSDIAVGPGDIFHIERLAQALGQFLRRKARKNVRGAARRKGNDHPHRTRGVALRAGKARCRKQSAGTRGPLQQSSPRNLHAGNYAAQARTVESTCSLG